MKASESSSKHSQKALMSEKDLSPLIEAWFSREFLAAIGYKKGETSRAGVTLA
jgi:hypothetical protein